MPDEPGERRCRRAGRSVRRAPGRSTMAPTIRSSTAPRPTVGMASVSPLPVHAAERLDGAEERDDHADHDAGLRGAGAVDGDVAEGGERRHPGGADGRDQRGDERDDEADDEGDGRSWRRPERGRRAGRRRSVEGAVTPLASPTPARQAEARRPTRPTRIASSSTEPSTWPRLAPTARSRASSRVRWATRIEKVLEITNTPTSRAIAAEHREDDL